MTKIARHRREELFSRAIFFGLLVAMGFFLGIFGWRLWVSRQDGQQFRPKPLVLEEKPDQTRVEARCYEFYIPADFEITSNPDCLTGAYARPRKYTYFQVSPYYGAQSEEAMIENWRQRWLTLGAVEKSRDRVIVGGRTGWRLEEFYPQNNESFVSYLVFLEDSIRVDGQEPITAFELRAWATTEPDRAFAVEVLQDWQWRF